jgi:hypothetical protein
MNVCSKGAFVLGKPFQLSLMFTGKAMNLPYSGAPESAWVGSGLTDKLSWKALPWTNNLPYYEQT